MNRPEKGRQALRQARDSAREFGVWTGEEEERGEGWMPVTPLGVSGKSAYYLNRNRQLVDLPFKEHGRLGLLGLVGDAKEWLEETAPRRNKNDEITGWRPDDIAELLIGLSSKLGVFDPDKRERGRGAWRGERGELILHHGARVQVFPPVSDAWEARAEIRPGLIQGCVYPADATLPMPGDKPAAGGPGGAGAQLLDLLASWCWRRGEIDAVLLLGWIGAAMIGGALAWRPMMWITGPKGVGKSALHTLLQNVFADAIVSLSDTSGAGVWQKLRRQSLPVAVDELEAAEDNRRALELVKLARVAASGGQMSRGTSDHSGVSFTIRSCFLFSSILIPPLLGQDLSRLAILELGTLKPDAETPDLSEARMRGIGQALRRRLIDGWHRFEATLEYFRRCLAAVGHEKRGQDQFGVLLTCADLLLHDGMPDSDTAAAWVNRLEAAAIGETEDEARDEERCLAHLMSQALDIYRNGERKTAAEWVRVAAGDGEKGPDADRLLGGYGLRVLRVSGQSWLVVANHHAGLAPLFRDTHWAGRSGTKGVYVQSLRRLPGARPTDKAVWFGGVPGRGVMIPVELAAPLDPDAGRMPWA